ncbi:MAG: response regulator [Lawsonibacter sp.]|jgi:signal transduction histidine kinase/CheY-like chemotaxis protein/HPt (histidine-containing phosphotransfer) domain-containing protein|nr:response regulator [Lawsonibacter sp.]
MRAGEQTSRHLLLAVITTVFSGMLGLITAVMAWELWTIPLIAGGCFGIWLLHIAKIGSDAVYEKLCAGLMLLEFFFFSVHESTLFDIPAVACIVILALFMLNKKWVLHALKALYILALLYHALILRTITYDIGFRDAFRLGLGAVVTFGGAALAGYWIRQRSIQRKWYERVFTELETAGKQNAVFLSNVSHELRTPINMVIGISEVALGKKLSPDIRADMTSIKLAGKRLSNQINNMLDYTEIMEGTLTPAKEDYMITSVLNDVITMTALQSNRQHLEIVFDIDPKLPAVLVGDAEKISHVLKILVENSIKFTEEGGINIRIGYRLERYGVNLIIDIRDTGIGMTDSQMLKMYDDFYQADSGSSRFVGGLGLGLPIALGLLNAMGGFIHFESKEQQGLHAHIVIPQGVTDHRPCIMLNNADQVCVGCYFRPERYSCDEVREYYDGLIWNLLVGLGINGYQTHNFEGLLKLLHTHQLTHVFIAQSEYEEDRAYYEELADTHRVVVIAEKEFVLDSRSKLHIMHKPFSALSVANLLNGDLGARGFAEAQAAGRKPFTCPGVRALAVDDEEMNLVVAKGVLGSYGLEVDTCLSGREAVARCASISYDIIFLDHMMPGFDGVQTLKKIREIQDGAYQDLPIIALTANTVSGAREMFRSEGFTEFVPKPIERTVLERVLRRVLPNRFIQYAEGSGEEDAFQDDVQAVLESPAAPEPEPEVHAGALAAEPEEAPADGAALPWERLSQAGVNVELGLNYCGGDESFFRQMLQMFHAQSGGKKAEIAALYEAANWTDYAIKVHALKSTALTIGAEALSAQAKELELAGKRGDVDFILSHHAALISAYDEICAQIAGI